MTKTDEQRPQCYVNQLQCYVSLRRGKYDDYNEYIHNWAI